MGDIIRDRQYNNISDIIVLPASTVVSGVFFLYLWFLRVLVSAFCVNKRVHNRSITPPVHSAVTKRIQCRLHYPAATVE